MGGGFDWWPEDEDDWDGWDENGDDPDEEYPRDEEVDT